MVDLETGEGHWLSLAVRKEIPNPQEKDSLSEREEERC